jgi:hypothetical protein
MNSSNVYRTYWDVEKILISQIYNNKWVMLLGLWEDEEAIKMYNRAMILNPRDLSSYMNKWISLNILWKVKLWKLYEFTVLLMRWGDKFIWFFELKKLKIKAFIEAKDYDWLANYLIDLERKTD